MLSRNAGHVRTDTSLCAIFAMHLHLQEMSGGRELMDGHSIDQPAFFFYLTVLCATKKHM